MTGTPVEMLIAAWIRDIESEPMPDLVTVEQAIAVIRR